MAIEATERDGTVILAVRVSPRSSRDAIEDRANESLRRILAAALKVPISAVKIVAGEKSRSKRVAVAGVTREQVLALAESATGLRS